MAESGNSTVTATAPTRCAISSIFGNLIGLLLGALSFLVLWMSSSVDWGVGWTTWIPAIIALIPAIALSKRRVLYRDGTDFEIESGWIMRRARRFSGQDLTIELLPTAGLWAVVLHQGNAVWPLATWVTRSRALRIAAFLDAAAPQGQWPRKETPLPSGDR